jgi:ribosomal protein L40E
LVGHSTHAGQFLCCVAPPGQLHPSAGIHERCWINCVVANHREHSLVQGIKPGNVASGLCHAFIYSSSTGKRCGARNSPRRERVRNCASECLNTSAEPSSRSQGDATRHAARAQTLVVCGGGLVRARSLARGRGHWWAVEHGGHHRHRLGIK